MPTDWLAMLLVVGMLFLMFVVLPKLGIST